MGEADLEEAEASLAAPVWTADQAARGITVAVYLKLPEGTAVEDWGAEIEHMAAFAALARSQVPLLLSEKRALVAERDALLAEMKVLIETVAPIEPV